MSSENWRSHHWETNRKPDGGHVYGMNETTFTIAWQRGAIQGEGRNGAFLTEVLEACLDFYQGKATNVSHGIGFTIAWQSSQQHGRGCAHSVLEACLDELEHKNHLFPCPENEEAVSYLRQCINNRQNNEELISSLIPCINVLNARINRRESQGILGTHEPDPHVGNQNAKGYATDG